MIGQALFYLDTWAQHNPAGLLMAAGLVFFLAFVFTGTVRDERRK
jgi:hypothetical protein